MTQRTNTFSRAGSWSGHDPSAYRSGLEEAVSAQIAAHGFPVLYEQHKIRYTRPESQHTYTPDFVLPNGIIIETKGLFTPDDRSKHLFIKAQRPDLDIRFVFSRSKARLSKTSQTTYADWCQKHGFKFADKRIPTEWLEHRSSSEDGEQHAN